MVTYRMPTVQLHKTRDRYTRGSDETVPMYRVVVDGVYTHLKVAQLSPPYWYVVANYGDWDTSDNDVYTASPGYETRRDAIDRAVHDHINGHWGYDYENECWTLDNIPVTN